MLATVKDFLIEKLRECGYRIKSIVPYSNYGYVILTDRTNFVVTYKREFYRSYGQHTNGSGIGQIASIDILMEAVKRGAMFLFSLPNLKTYVIDSKIFLENGKRVSHLDGHVAIGIKEFTNFDELLEQDYLDWV